MPRHALDASPEERAEGTHLDVKVFGFAGGERCEVSPKPKTDGVVGNAGGPTVAGSAAVSDLSGADGTGTLDSDRWPPSSWRITFVPHAPQKFADATTCSPQWMQYMARSSSLAGKRSNERVYGSRGCAASHSRARRRASAIWVGIIWPATRSRFWRYRLAVHRPLAGGSNSELTAHAHRNAHADGRLTFLAFRSEQSVKEQVGSPMQSSTFY